MRAAWAFAVLLSLPTAAQAGTKAGVTLPDKASVGGKDLILNGMGVREATILNVEVYVAGLYLEAKSKDLAAILAADHPKRLVMHFKRDVGKDDLVEAFEEGFEKNGAPAAMGARVKQFIGFMVDVKSGDEITMSYEPEKGVAVSIKGAAKGTIPGADFEKVLYSIFVGPKPPNASLKEGLLGQ